MTQTDLKCGIVTKLNENRVSFGKSLPSMWFISILLYLFYTTTKAQTVIYCQQQCQGMDIVCKDGADCIIYCQVTSSCESTSITGPTDAILYVYCGDNDEYPSESDQCYGVRISGETSSQLIIKAGEFAGVLDTAQIRGPISYSEQSLLYCGEEDLNQCALIASIGSQTDTSAWYFQCNYVNCFQQGM